MALCCVLSFAFVRVFLCLLAGTRVTCVKKRGPANPVFLSTLWDSEISFVAWLAEIKATQENSGVTSAFVLSCFFHLHIRIVCVIFRRPTSELSSAQALNWPNALLSDGSLLEFTYLFTWADRASDSVAEESCCLWEKARIKTCCVDGWCLRSYFWILFLKFVNKEKLFSITLFLFAFWVEV